MCVSVVGGGRVGEIEREVCVSVTKKKNNNNNNNKQKKQKLVYNILSGKTYRDE